jgi:hypothetical protein
MIAGNGVTTAGGIQINGPGNQNQNNVTIRSSSFVGMVNFDIQANNPGQMLIDNNTSYSTGTTACINVGGRVSGVITVTNNVCPNAITNATASDLTNGFIRKCGNVVGGTSEACTWNVTTNSTTANRMMIGGGPGVQPTAAPAGTATTLWHGNASGVGSYGAVNLATDVAGVTSVANGGTGVSDASGEMARLKQAFIFNTTASVNFNSANTDTPLTITLPTGFTRFAVNRVYVSHASQTLTTSTIGLFSATGGGGVAIQPLTANTVASASDAAANNIMLTATTATNSSFVASSLATPNTIYFRVGTAQGAAATADVTVFYVPLL